MKIYTKTGDNGTTSLIGGKRISKGDLRIEAYGTIDELMAHIGLLFDKINNHIYKELFIEIQTKLMICSSIIASIDNKNTLDITTKDIIFIESQIDELNKDLVPLKKFVLPGGHTIVSYCHVTRTICRRAERCVVRIDDDNNLLFVIKYLNRLSDLFFVLSRKLSSELNCEEILWNPTL
jgi:cob(I)alamin adenosyltransferase